MTGDELIVTFVGLALALWFARRMRRTRRRKKSLRKGENGAWYWTDFDGTERSSPTRPDRPGGEWDSGGGFDGGDADGGGGD